MNARALSENLASLLRREHGALAEFLVALAAFDGARGWAELGHASLFTYLHRELRLSKAASQHRKVAAELIQQVPAVAERLRSGELCLTSVIEAARVVTPASWQEMLPRFYGLSRREAAEVVAALQPHPAPPVRTIITAVAPTAPRETLSLAAAAPAPDLFAAPAKALSSPAPVAAAHAGSPGEPNLPSAAPARRTTDVVPLSAEQKRLHVTVSAAFARKLEQARAARPDLPDEALLEAALDLLLAQSAKRKGLVDRPRKTPPPSKAEHVPAHVKREVWERDGGRCQYRLASGEICGSIHDLQFDHVTPRARGGASSVDNLRLACRPHNLEAARRVFGDAWMERYCGKPRRAAKRMPGAETAGAP